MRRARLQIQKIQVGKRLQVSPYFHHSYQAPLVVTNSKTRKHRARHDRRFPCGTCARRFGTKNDLDRHRATVHHQGAAGFYCDVTGCKRRGRAFSRKDNFVKHLRDVHGLVQGADGTVAMFSTRKGDGSEDVARGDGTELSGECECGMLRKENEELREELDALRREMEACGSRQREELVAYRERESRLWRLLERAMSRDNNQMASQQR